MSKLQNGTSNMDKRSEVQKQKIAQSEFAQPDYGWLFAEADLINLNPLNRKSTQLREFKYFNQKSNMQSGDLFAIFFCVLFKRTVRKKVQQ